MRVHLTVFASLAGIVAFCGLGFPAVAAQSREVSEVVDKARAAPPEVLADLFLGLLESGRVTDKALRAEMMEELWTATFRLAAPAPGIVVHPSGSAPTPDEDPLNMTGRFRVDRLTTRARALRLMLDHEPGRARETFVQWESFEFPAEDCGVPVLPDVTGYYDLAQVVFERGFTKEQRAEARHEQFLEEILLRLNSPLQLAAAAALLTDSRLTVDQRRSLAGLYAERLGAIRGGDRAFHIAVRRQGLMTRVRALIEQMAAREPTAHAIAFALRSFLAAHLEAPRCADIAELEENFRRFREDTDRLTKLRADPKIQVNIREDPSHDFNQIVLPALAARGFTLDPLPLLIEAEKVVEAPRDEDERPATSAAFQERYWQLVKTRPGRAGGTETDSVAQWRSEFDELLAMAATEASGKDATPLAAFQAIRGVYAGLADLALDAGQAEAAAGRWVEFISGSGVQHSHAGHWFAAVKHLVQRSRPLAQAASEDVEARVAKGMSIPGTNPLVPEALRRRLVEAQHPVVALYGWVEQVFPEQRKDWR